MKTKIDLRLKYKSETGKQPIKGLYWVCEELQNEYFRWLEEKLLNTLNKSYEIEWENEFKS